MRTLNCVCEQCCSSLLCYSIGKTQYFHCIFCHVKREIMQNEKQMSVVQTGQGGSLCSLDAGNGTVRKHEVSKGCGWSLLIFLIICIATPSLDGIWTGVARAWLVAYAAS